MKCKCLDDQEGVTGGTSFGVAEIAWEMVVSSNEQCFCKGRRLPSRPTRPAPKHRQKAARALTSKGLFLPRKLVGRGWLEAFRLTSWFLGWLISPVARVECHRHKQALRSSTSKVCLDVDLVHHARHEYCPSDSLGDPKPLSRLSGMIKPPTMRLSRICREASEIL
jgi:hypothetical protein